MDDIAKLKETSLPPINEFYSSLTDSNTTTSNYQHAQDVWDKTNCSNLKDYVNVYLNLDVALLADIYLQWRSVLLELFDLDCLYFLTLSPYAIEAMYYKCGVKLDSISDPNLYHMINSNIRGGLCSVDKRHVVANNVHTNPNFDCQSTESNYLLYIGFNSLYPSVMSKFKLPMGDFVKLNEMELNTFKNHDITNIDTEGNTGYYIYCDIKPVKPDIIEKTDPYPLLISPMNIQDHHISGYSKHLLNEKNLKLPKPNTKLVAHHCGVQNYLITLPLLQFLIRNGVEIGKIHKVIKFKQSFYLKQFIDGNIKMRASASNPFIKNALKLINNSVYGRTLLNPLNYATQAKICHDQNESSMLKSFNKPTFRKVDIINNDRFLVTHNRSSVKASSPIYVGFSIRDHVKLFMYKFWYSTIVPTYGEKVEFVYSDTDSFIINLKTEDITKEISGPLAEHLDLSNFPSDHPLYNSKCKGELGKLKIETAPHHMKEFICLKPKAYTYTTTKDDQVSNNTLKGIPGHIRKGLTLATYEECLYSNTRFSKDIFNLRFYNKHMSLTKNSKVILSCFEDKRYYINNLESYGYCHPKIPKNNITSTNNDDCDSCENTLEGKGEKRKRQGPIPIDFQAKKKKLGMFIVEKIIT